MNSIANKKYQKYLERYDLFIKHGKKTKSVYSEQLKNNNTNVSLFDSIHNFYKRLYGLKSLVLFKKQDFFIIIILVSSFVYILFTIKLFVFDMFKNLSEYYTFKKIHREYRNFFLNHVEILLKENQHFGVDNESLITSLEQSKSFEKFTSDNISLKKNNSKELASKLDLKFSFHSSSSINSKSLNECDLDLKDNSKYLSQFRIDIISNDLEKLDSKESISNNLSTIKNRLTLIEYLNNNEKKLEKLSEFYANICTRLDLADQTDMLPDIEFFIEWILIIEDAKRKLKKIKKENKFIYYY
jgi:hypothetical protein